jgi:hypothetical protein
MVRFPGLCGGYGPGLQSTLLSNFERSSRINRGLRGLCGRLPGSAGRCFDFWAFWRSYRPQADAHHHDAHYGRRNVPDRPTADILPTRHCGTRSPRCAQAAAGHWARRRMGGGSAHGIRKRTCRTARFNEQHGPNGKSDRTHHGFDLFSIVALLPEPVFLAWGWRVPFLVSIVVVGVGLFIRLKLDETPSYLEVHRTGRIAKIPIVEVIRHYPRSFLTAVGLKISDIAYATIGGIFVIAYVTRHLGYRVNWLSAPCSSQT